ncbi:MBL fold metallo-hydrolase [Sorangium sp. So ce131]|uniref:MBL fold metallo-hydrolase n=1 Tax=Sorangium sp. So ce131 TaxID=3133282 RepID=UPI003F6005DB
MAPRPSRSPSTSLLLAAALLALALALAGLSCVPARILGGNVATLFDTPAPVPDKVHAPYRPEARLAVLWVGHATTLVQIDDKLILTDPVFTSTVGVIVKRLVEPGLDPEDLPPVDAVLISHMHLDHLSLGSLSLIERKVRALLVPQGGLVYVPNYTFDSVEVPMWTTWQQGDLKITAVPVRHSGYRYGLDRDWMTSSFTGYVVEYHGITVYFGGDTAYDRAMFQATRARFPAIDLAILPIAPVTPRDFMTTKHVDPAEAVQAFLDLGARRMLAIHFDTFINSTDQFGEAPRELRRVMAARGLGPDRVILLRHGGQRVLIDRGAPRGAAAAGQREARAPGISAGR